MLFGVATKAKCFRIELLARNRASVLFPDAGGVKPSVATLTRGAPPLQEGRFCLQRLLAAVRSTGMRAAVSRNAGAYLCNYAYWRAVEAAAQTGVPRVVAFVHVPPLRMKALPRRAVRHPHSLAQLTRGGEAILLAIPAILRGSTRRA